MRIQSLPRTQKPLRLDDEVHFIRSWLEKPLAIGAVTPSSRALARTMARYVDPASTGPVIELGPGTGPITEALVARGVAEERLILVEFNPTFCQLLRAAISARDGGAGRRLPVEGDVRGRSTPAAPPPSSPACRCSPSRCACACGCCATRSR